MHNKQVPKMSDGCVPVSSGSSCKKCSGNRIKVVYFEHEGKKFAVCEDCGDIRSVGSSLQDCYGKWKSYREAPSR